MKKMLIRTNVFLLAILCLGLMQVYAQAPNSLSYQGRLIETNGDPVANDTSVIFSIYDAISAGTQLWIDTIIVSPDSSGIFTAELADIPYSVFQSGNKLYLQIEVLGDSPMSPRQLLTSAPYAYAAEMIPDNSITAAKIATGAVGASEIAADAVGSSEIAADAVGASEIAANAVGASEIGASAVGNSELANNAVDGNKIQNSSITDNDILDESGIANAQTTTSTTLTETMQTLESVTITTPAAGYIHVFGKCYLRTYGTTGSNFCSFQIDQTAGGANLFPYVSRAGVGSHSSTSQDDYFNIFVQRIYYLSAGTHTFILEGKRDQASGVAIAYHKIVTAIYLSSSYGTVETTAESPGDFDNYEIIPETAGDDSQNNANKVIYKADLRQLEQKDTPADESDRE